MDARWQELRLRSWLTALRQDRVALSSRYDTEGGGLSDADLEFDRRIDPRWRLEGIATYSGYRSELDQLNLRITRDLHCWLASVTYNMEADELRLNLGIKAFPFEDQDWTVGNRGARLGSYSQYYY